MFGHTFCPLGDAAAMPTMAIVRKFRHEFEAKLKSAPQAFVPAPGTRSLPVVK
jgi:NADH-quinone oxidoreductase subunit F